MAKQIYTAWQARCEKRDSELKSIAESDARVAAAKEIEAVLAANPQIGVLIRKGKPVYYAGDREASHPAALV